MLYQPTYVDMCVLELRLSSEAVNCLIKNLLSNNSQKLLEACNLFKKRLRHRCFLANFAKLLRISPFILHLR